MVLCLRRAAAALAQLMLALFGCSLRVEHNITQLYPTLMTIGCRCCVVAAVITGAADSEDAWGCSEAFGFALNVALDVSPYTHKPKIGELRPATLNSAAQQLQTPDAQALILFLHPKPLGQYSGKIPNLKK